MDDRTKGLDERTSGRGDDYLTGRSDDASTRPYAAPRADERGPGGGGAPGTTSSASARPGVGRDTTADPQTRQIRADIERTREDMSETIEAIQDRLRPSNLASNAAESVRSAATERMHDMADSVADSEIVHDVRANPVPAVMIGVGIVGLAWWAFGREEHSHGYGSGRYRSRSYRRNLGTSRGADEYYRGRDWEGDMAGGYAAGTAYGERTDMGARGYGYSGQERGRDFARSTEDVGHKAGEYASRAGERAGEYVDEARRATRQTARRAQSGLHRMLNENPLMIAAAAAAVGAAVGMALPETERENELMGETRDSLVENIQDKAQDAAERVQNAATNAVERVQNAAANVADDVQREAAAAVGLASASADDKPDDKQAAAKTQGDQQNKPETPRGGKKPDTRL